jgi:hypothetical protein
LTAKHSEAPSDLSVILVSLPIPDVMNDGSHAGFFLCQFFEILQKSTVHTLIFVSLFQFCSYIGSKAAKYFFFVGESPGFKNQLL